MLKMWEKCTIAQGALPRASGRLVAGGTCYRQPGSGDIYTLSIQSCCRPAIQLFLKLLPMPPHRAVVVVYVSTVLIESLLHFAFDHVILTCLNIKVSF